MAVNRARSLDVLVVGSINLDMAVRTPRVPAGGETVLGDSFATNPGGKGANQAVAAARLGARTALVGKVGADGPGEQLLAGLAGEGIDTQAIAVDAGVSTGTAFILIEPDGENRIVVVPGANSALQPDDLDRVLFAGANVVLVSQEIPADTVQRALALGREHGCVTILNPAPARAVPDEVLGLTDILIPNRAEAAALSGQPVTSLAEARQAAHRLLSRGVGTVVMTLGEDGALAVRVNQEERVPAVPVTAVDTTAAGDAFCGAVAASLARGDPLLAALTTATAAAALTVTRPGAQPALPTADEVSALLLQRR